MAFNVSDFRSEMKLDGARPNLFQCEIKDLNRFAVAGRGSDAQRKFSFMCRAAQLPGSTVNAIPVNYFGRELKFSGNRTFTEWTVTVINDEDFRIRNAIERWMNALNSHVGNIRSLVAPADYQLDALVTQYGKAGPDNAIKKYKFVGMFPIDLSPIELDWGANDTIEEFAVTFAYQWWESTEIERTTDDDQTVAGVTAAPGIALT